MTPKSTQKDQRRTTSDVMAWAFFGVSATLFVISLTQDAFYIDRADNPRAWASCAGLLVIGWIGVLNGVLAWLANPLLATTWGLMCFRRLRIIAFLIAIASLGLALSSLSQQQILSNEAGDHSRITGYGAGYWLWIASIAAAAIGSLSGIRFRS